MNLIHGQLKPDAPFYDLFFDGFAPLKSLVPVPASPDNPACFVLDPERLTAEQTVKIAEALCLSYVDISSADAALVVVRAGLPLQCAHFACLYCDGSPLPVLDSADVIRALRDAPPFDIQMNAVDAYCLVSLLQLALRHPDTHTECAALAVIGDAVARAIQGGLSQLSPAVAESLDLGWTPAFDYSPVADPVVLYDPEYGGITDGQLQAICEDAHRRAADGEN